MFLVPQGSILGPLRFIIYIDYLHNSSSMLKFLLFADDTNAFVSGENLNDLIININRELTNWLVRKIKNKSCDIQPSINGLNIKHVTSVKFLGIIIDDKLN